ncbi:tyrosine type site-specific recombinase [Lentisphaera araneosa HTCC2155]|uniref:Tyrosine type site-specific recombinase n=1 Tax=Lentisphaera araneosa HTCC2155 TaxID=313628 RepID=A6DSB3_9BACT|nr:site-specific integrase [Lentisphaera araneosa]EDM25458.1 tyrosine type site-specific recombinase [Lentisphaera araneosa HTCC2155]
MSVRRKKLASGKYVRDYYYEFRMNGEPYRGTTGCSEKKDAINFVRKLKRDLKTAINAKKHNKSLIHFRESVTEGLIGTKVKLEDVFPIFKNEFPKFITKTPSEKRWELKESIWRDFTAFLTSKGVCNIHEVTEENAREYWAYLRRNGRYNKEVKNAQGRKKYKSKRVKLSNTTVDEYRSQLQQVFTVMMCYARLIDNPFRKIAKLESDRRKMDIFTPDELIRINEFIYSDKIVPFCLNGELNKLIVRAVFIIGINTGMRLADIALLKWKDVSLSERMITIFMSKIKTPDPVEIPISKKLLVFLKEQEKLRLNDYVCPELAKLYLEDAGKISFRFSQMLKYLNIETCVLHEGRARQNCIKGIHSLRHQFCYLAGMRGVPENLLQSIVGHMSKDMTRYYMMHKTHELKHKAIAVMDDFEAVPDKNKPSSEVFTDIKKYSAEDLLKAIKDMIG